MKIPKIYSFCNYGLLSYNLHTVKFTLSKMHFFSNSLWLRANPAQGLSNTEKADTMGFKGIEYQLGEQDSYGSATNML